METVYLSLGSNIGNRQQYIKTAIKRLGADPQIMIEQVAAFYETAPVGNVSQRAFLNTAVRLLTTLSPQKLLKLIHQIEQQLHRTRKIHWGPRTLDIDIIFYGDQTIKSADLQVPHPETFNRRFVLVPLMELIDQSFPYYHQLASAINQIDANEQPLKKVPATDGHDQDPVAESVKTILTAIGDDPTRSGLVETPDRVSRMYQEIFSSIGLEDFTDYKLFHSADLDQSKMVMMKQIPFYSMCEHHMMPFWGTVSVAYLPNNGTIIGLSKIPRLVDFVSHKLTLQEALTDEISDQLNKILTPKGVAVVVDARHMCVEMRGVKKTGSTTRTVRFSGKFSDSVAYQNEFLSALR
ncbi:bifunctional protein FolKE [Lentilactobacillus fungorum]|uniref:GTP cyclohydrolase 1 n=1 Tax=Lentilactobacillus fungorum TaxID=2201250 RepID=A0ABQ3VX99_9LACO|nr:GTP cyclohydrolase I FolE [Lentilactobacillus fungorum]GHP12811.1 bifunctional protein FolKE [Lentilactobacillus fungorum]